MWEPEGVPHYIEEVMEKKCFAYILKCSDGSLYTGWTNDLDKRLAAHNAGAGAKYTKSRRPVQLVYCEEFADRHAAMKREYEIKQLDRGQKQELIASGHMAAT